MASEKKLPTGRLRTREFLRHLFQEGDLGYVHYAYRVRPEVTKEELQMLTKDPYLSEKDFHFIVQDIGPQLINYFPVEERLAGLTAEEIEAYLKRLKSQSSSNSKSANK